MKTSKLIEQQKIATSITVSPIESGYEVKYFLRSKKKDGSYQTKTIKVKRIIEDVLIPEISNYTVNHLYNKYQHLVLPNGFYINYYN